MKKTLLIMAALFVLTSCKTQQPFSLSFGSGGGFTGIYNTYTVSEDGKVYKEQSSDPKSKTLVTTLNKSDVKEVQELIAKLNFTAAPINKPGNMSSFLNLTKDGKVYQNTWSGGTSGDAAIDALSQKLNSYIPKK